MSALKQHAEAEFRAAGWMKDDGTFDDFMQEAMCKHVLGLLEVFAEEGHSGFSAAYAIDLFKKLASFEPIFPLTGKDEEWMDCGEGVWQNKRCSHVFKKSDRFNGQPYDLNAVVFRESAGFTFTNRHSMRPILFPYYPTTVTVDIEEDATEDRYEAEAAQAWLNRSLK